MNKPTTQRFVASAILMSLGWLSFIWIHAFASAFLLAAWLVLMPREHLHRVVPRREILWAIFMLPACAAIVVASKILVPASAGRAVEGFFRHPAVVIPLWLICLWFGYRGWRRSIRNVA